MYYESKLHMYSEKVNGEIGENPQQEYFWKTFAAIAVKISVVCLLI
jgi:hypothetical protein